MAKTLLERWEKLQQDYTNLYTQLEIEQELLKLQQLEEVLARPGFWHDPEVAQVKTREFNQLKAAMEPWSLLKTQLSDYQELVELARDDEAWLKEVGAQLDSMEQVFAKLRQEARFNGKYDNSSVILRLTSGTGGLDAEDFTKMLERMYLRFCQRRGFEVETIERQLGAESGLKTAVMEIGGRFAYGLLKSEHGVHRLVRLSPFNSDSLRQTSFAMVEVLPQISSEEIELNPSDLKIDVYRAGGHGGQSVNTTDSAVRITHLPTNTVVSIQNERSQIQNRNLAMNILRAKLRQLQEEQQQNDLSKLKAGESASWGKQIRNYVLHPYTLVKDTRTKYEEANVDSVLDGQIDGFIETFLDQQASV